ncbi:unnamed protein product [Malus baccata var. baccata]
MLPTNAHQNPTQVPDTARTPDFSDSFAYFNLTACYLTTMYRAYKAGDYPALAFVAFIYVAYWGLDKCLQVSNRLPRGEKSVKKEALRFTYCGLTSGILFGFACQFRMFMPLAAVVLMYFVAIATSLLLFFVFYIEHYQNGCYEKINNNLDNV